MPQRTSRVGTESLLDIGRPPSRSASTEFRERGEEYDVENPPIVAPLLPQLPQAPVAPSRLNRVMATQFGSAAVQAAASTTAMTAGAAVVVAPGISTIHFADLLRHSALAEASPLLTATAEGLHILGAAIVSAGIGLVPGATLGYTISTTGAYAARSRVVVGDYAALQAARQRVENGELPGSDGRNQLEPFCNLLARAEMCLSPDSAELVRNTLLQAALHPDLQEAVADLVGHENMQVRQAASQNIVAHPIARSMAEAFGERRHFLQEATVTVIERSQASHAIVSELQEARPPLTNDEFANVLRTKLNGHEPIFRDQDARDLADALLDQFNSEQPGPSPASELLMHLNDPAQQLHLQEIAAQVRAGVIDELTANDAVVGALVEHFLDTEIVRLRNANSE
jgi:hypothetical protein